MNFKDYLKQNAQKLDKTLESILADFLKETEKTNPKLLSFAQEFLNSCKGGKRIRGVLVKLGYEIATPRHGGARNDIVRIGAAFEILHTALLIHDDIIDQSSKRRDKPSLYMALGGEHYGISQAICLGDIGLYLPIKIITETSFSDEYKLKALNYFSQILINTGWGQVLDVEKSPDKEFINLFKTAKYTISGPLQIGAILGGADDKLIKDLGIIGDNLGIAFQIKDDVLDGELDSIKAQAQVLEYVLKAQKIIPKITKDQKIIKILNGLTEFLVNRDK